MRQVWVFFQKEGQKSRTELLFPAGVRVKDLLPPLIEKLQCPTQDTQGQQIKYALKVYPDAKGSPDEIGIELSRHQTLAEAGVLDRSLLVLCRRSESENLGELTDEPDAKDRTPEVEPWPRGKSDEIWQPEIPSSEATEESEVIPFEEWLSRPVVE